MNAQTENNIQLKTQTKSDLQGSSCCFPKMFTFSLFDTMHKEWMEEMYRIPKAIIIEQPLCTDTYSKVNKIKFEKKNIFQCTLYIVHQWKTTQTEEQFSRCFCCSTSIPIVNIIFSKYILWPMICSTIDARY